MEFADCYPRDLDIRFGRGIFPVLPPVQRCLRRLLWAAQQLLGYADDDRHAGVLARYIIDNSVISTAEVYTEKSKSQILNFARNVK